MKAKHKFKIIYILPSLALLIITGLFIYAYAQEQIKENNAIEKIYPTFNLQRCINAEQSDYNEILAIKTNDIQLCDKSNSKEWCKARVQKDATFCDDRNNIDKDNITKEETDECKAIITGNELLCGNSTNCKAETTKNPLLCNLTGEEQEACKAFAGLDETYFSQENAKQRCEQQKQTYDEKRKQFIKNNQELIKLLKK